MNKEIEIKVKIEKVQPLLDILKQEGKFKYKTQQKDEYLTPSDRNFTEIRPVKEWLRLRNTGGKYSINYKNWIYGQDGKSTHCHEHETEIKDIEQLRRILHNLNFKTIVTVDKKRKTWHYQNWEVSIDSVKNCGDFVEIEYKGNKDVNPKQEAEKMVQFLKDLGCGQIERDYQGYPFRLMFPDEVKWETI